MTPISIEQADRLIAFDRDAQGNVTGNGRLQLEGAVAVHNIIARNRFAYLADEVGMGKTYVALGVMALLRHFHPDSRVVVLAPRENIQHKWIKEYRNFVARNWRVTDNSVRGFDGRPARELTPCHSLAQLAQEVCLSPHQELFLRMTSFSPQLGGKDPKQGMKRARAQLCSAMPHLDRRTLPIRGKGAERFRDDYGRVINGVLPPIDLLIVDEAHNYKHGYRSKRVALRNHLTALVFGHPAGADVAFPSYASRVRGLLLLSATPFENDYVDLYNQLDVFGFGEAPIRDAGGKRAGNVTQLADAAIEETVKRALLRHVLIRRVTGLQIGNEIHTKNMYRREWRKGGLKVHDHPMEIPDPKQRLIVALVQKKVAEVLGSERFNNRFQIGMLSSFESFLQSTTRRSVSLRDEGQDDESDAERVFDGEQSELEAEERRGIDARLLARLLRSYQRRFGKPLPHPKLDATVEELARAFETGEKSLVFVRRLATMGELAARLNDRYDQWLERYMCERLPELQPRVRELFAQYEAEKRGAQVSQGVVTPPDPLAEVELGQVVYEQDEDTSGTDSFFAWFFRGKETRGGILSGAAFQKNRLISASSAYSTLFEDDYVARLLDVRTTAEIIAALAVQLRQNSDEIHEQLRRRAFASYAASTSRRDGYGRLYVLEAYQIAALGLLSQGAVDPLLRRRASLVHQEAYPTRQEREEAVPPGFPGPEAGLGITTFVTLLEDWPQLRDELLPEPKTPDFEARFIERERRRELLSALSRLGASYIDLYLLAIADIGGFELSGGAPSRSDEGRPEVRLARSFIGLLEAQRLAAPEQRQALPGAHAYRELTSAAAAFEDVLITNFPAIRDQRLWELRRTYGTLLQNQSPVGTSSRSKVKRLVSQFRMPGYPLVLVTTDILQEGEDLHTFCARVLHYGITWTPSAMEQRTGRVDRIGSLTQRRLDSQPEARPETKLQVYYPHLRDTVEVLQVERVLERLNRFIAMVHRNADPGERDARAIDTAQEMVADRPERAQITHRLESAYPVDQDWLATQATCKAPALPDIDGLLGHFEQVSSHLEKHLGTRNAGRGGFVGGRPTRHEGTLLGDGDSAEPFELLLVPQRCGRATLARCRAKVGRLDLDEPAIVDALSEVQRALGSVKICAEVNAKVGGWEVSVEREMSFHPQTSQLEELEGLVRRTIHATIRLRAELEHAVMGERRAHG